MHGRTKERERTPEMAVKAADVVEVLERHRFAIRSDLGELFSPAEADRKRVLDALDPLYNGVVAGILEELGFTFTDGDILSRHRPDALEAGRKAASDVYIQRLGVDLQAVIEEVQATARRAVGQALLDALSTEKAMDSLSR